jgi:hypothetical protein
MPHEEFKNYIKLNIDLGMQVSFSETYNIVGADVVDCNVPIVVSPEIQWASDFFKVDPNYCNDIVKGLKFAWKTKFLGAYRLNKLGLAKNSKEAKKVWVDLFKY